MWVYSISSCRVFAGRFKYEYESECESEIFRFHFYHFVRAQFCPLRKIKAHFPLSLKGDNFKLKEEHTKYINGEWNVEKNGNTRQRNGKAHTHTTTHTRNIFKQPYAQWIKKVFLLSWKNVSPTETHKKYGKRIIKDSFYFEFIMRVASRRGQKSIKKRNKIEWNA